MESLEQIYVLKDLRIEGGHLVKPFRPENEDCYIQCIADIGASSVKIIPIACNNTKIAVDSVVRESGEPVTIQLREEGYGYVTVQIETTSIDCRLAKKIVLAILKPAPNNKLLYATKNRPQFHYTAPYGYINDPNGMFYNAHTKEYHLFYQAYPYSQNSSDKHWGHITTTDLVTFKEQPTALYPDKNGAMWSGTAIIDYNNVAQLYKEETPPEARILLIYYVWKEGQVGAGIAYTTDNGRSWVKAEKSKLFNFIGAYPQHIDPKVFWDEKINKWIMFCATGEIFTSVNLWDWNFKGIDQSSECPDIYKMKVEETGEQKYVHTYGGTDYRIGDLVENKDGTITFLAETDFIKYNGDSLNRRDLEIESIIRKNGWFTGQTGSFYAAQHYYNAPNNRIISVGWLIEKGLDPTGTWAGAMSIATEQKLHKKTTGDYALYSYPVEEIKGLHGDLLFSVSGATIVPNSKNLLLEVTALYADINGEFLLDGNVTEFGFHIRTGADGGDITIKYDVCNQLLISDYSNSKHNKYNGVRTMKMKKTEDGKISLRVLLNSIIVESFGNKGEACISSIFCRDHAHQSMELFVVGGKAIVEKLEIYEMKSAWRNNDDVHLSNANAN